MNKQIDPEQRKYPRYAVDTAVELRLLNDWEKHIIGCYGYTKNISLGGICVKLSRYKAATYPRIKENIKLQVRIPVLDVKKYLEVNGRIAWYLQEKENYNIGIQFVTNDNETKTSLSGFIASLRSQ